MLFKNGCSYWSPKPGVGSSSLSSRASKIGEHADKASLTKKRK